MADLQGQADPAQGCLRSTGTFSQELDSYGLVEISEGCKPIEQQEERVKLYASLLNAERWPFQKEAVVLEHDAKCRLPVERLRGDGTISISNARFWFLTYDTKLPRFAKRVPDNGDQAPELPFCISRLGTDHPGVDAEDRGLRSDRR